MTASEARLAERDRCLRDIAHYESVLAGSPSSDRTRMLLAAERAHLERVKHFLMAAGLIVPVQNEEE